jgi:hypothetical protein
VGALQEDTTMLNIPTEDPESFHPEDANYSKRCEKQLLPGTHTFFLNVNNPSGYMAFNSGVQHPIQTLKF